MYRNFLFLAGLVLASTAQAQTPDRTLMHHIAVDYAFTGTSSSENRTDPAEPASVTDAPIDGSRALLGDSPSTLPIGAANAGRESSFRAEVRGDVVSNAWGEAEFGAVLNPDRSSGAFVVSLGVCGEQSAILFTRRSATPLEVGRYRISEQADEVNAILALVLTGSPTHPTGVFRGVSGWLVVTAASEQLTAGEFQIDAIGFTAAEPEQEDRHVNVTGSFSATTASSSFGVCDSTE